jgi:Holliday junction DNA helicase RuvA
MIEYIKGILVESTPLKTVLELNGIGYKILIPLSNYAKLPSLGKQVCLFISSVIREDSHRYFGFLTSEERDLFETLIEISGVGPKTALALLGHLEPTDLQIAVSQSDLTSICKVPGIGKKTAERLIVEMRDKVQKNPPVFSLPSSKSEPTLAGDALRALVNLGYQPLLAQKAIKSVIDEGDQETDLGKIITSALRKL